MKKVYILLISFLIVNISNAQWIPQNSGTTNDLRSVYFINANTGYVVGDNGVFLKTIDGGENWISQNVGTTGNLMDVFFCTESTGFIAGQEGIFKTTDSGLQWYSVYTGFSKQIDFINDSLGYANCGDLYKTTNGGESWEFVNDLGPYSEFDFITPDTGFLGKSEVGIYSTYDGGLNWILQYDLGQWAGWCHSICFTGHDTGFIVGEIGNTMMFDCIYKTFDGGTNWDYDLDGEGYDICFSNSYTGYTVGQNGMITKTINNGVSWSSIGSPTNENLYSVYFPTLDTGYTVGSDGIILSTTIGGVVGVNEENLNKISFKIYPNPASDKISILFSELDSSTQLSILNIKGQEKIKIQITKNETTVDLRSLANGIYFIKISSANMTKTEILLKE